MVAKTSRLSEKSPPERNIGGVSCPDIRSGVRRCRHPAPLGNGLHRGTGGGCVHCCVLSPPVLRWGIVALSPYYSTPAQVRQVGYIIDGPGLI